jgi:dihydrofolate reductase
MRTLFSFVFTTLDGFHADPDGTLDWGNVDDDFHDFAIRQLNDIDTLLFGRVTYEHMAAIWPTPEASGADPVIADRMNSIDKVVFSSSLAVATWSNTELVRGDAVPFIWSLKERAGSGDLALFGSSTLTASLLKAGVVDEVRIMVNPVVLGDGERLYDGITERVALNVTHTTAFRNGNVLISANPVPGLP